jgi:Domain of unknown function (DUF4157)
MRELFRRTDKRLENHTRVPRQATRQPGASGLNLPLLQLQHTIGNRAVGRFIQAKLEVSKPADVYEQEADRVAEQVMRMPDPNAMNKAEIGKQRDGIQIQRECAKCEEELSRQAMNEEDDEAMMQTKKLSRQAMNEEDDEAMMQTKEISGQTPELRPEIEDGVQALRGGGQPLPQSARAFFEPRFNQDFSQVRIHTDQRAAESAKSVNALAYTVGRDVVFGSGQYSPETPAGQRLLAHELTHVVQQRGVDTNRLDQAGRHQAQTPSLQRQGARRRSHRFTAEGVNVVVRPRCDDSLTFAAVEEATRTALDRIFNSDCIEESRRTRIQRNLTRHGLDIFCRALAGACAEGTGFFIPANIMTLGTDRTNCPPLESSILHEIIHLTRGIFTEQLPESCDNSCLGTERGVGPELCRDIDVFGKRRAAP